MVRIGLNTPKRNINSTLIYTNLITFGDDEFHTVTAKKELMKPGFD